MKENMEKLKAEVTENFKQLFGEKISREDKTKVEKYFSIYLQQKQTAFYNGKEEIPNMKAITRETLELLCGIQPDSKAEAIMYEALMKEKISFQFQYKIGPFRVDFLIDDWLVFELDGPMHVLNPKYDERRKEYIEKKGYTVLAIPLWAVAYDKQSVIQIIKEKLG